MDYGWVKGLEQTIAFFEQTYANVLRGYTVSFANCFSVSKLFGISHVIAYPLEMANYFNFLSPNSTNIKVLPTLFLVKVSCPTVTCYIAEMWSRSRKE
jgi:hypothetical protein